MTIEQKALELANEALAEIGGLTLTLDEVKRLYPALLIALRRALEAHELDKSRHAAELREQAERFSEAVTSWFSLYSADIPAPFRPFILAPVDPLVEALTDLGLEKADEWAPDIRKAMAARGLAIVKKEAVNG